jgi:hypothetical protein
MELSKGLRVFQVALQPEEQPSGVHHPQVSCCSEFVGEKSELCAAECSQRARKGQRSMPSHRRHGENA